MNFVGSQGEVLLIKSTANMELRRTYPGLTDLDI
jgi:hypothetical protein